MPHAQEKGPKWPHSLIDLVAMVTAKADLGDPVCSPYLMPGNDVARNSPSDGWKGMCCINPTKWLIGRRTPRRRPPRKSVYPRHPAARRMKALKMLCRFARRGGRLRLFPHWSNRIAVEFGQRRKVDVHRHQLGPAAGQAAKRWGVPKRTGVRRPAPQNRAFTPRGVVECGDVRRWPSLWTMSPRQSWTMRRRTSMAPTSISRLPFGDTTTPPSPRTSSARGSCPACRAP